MHFLPEQNYKAPQLLLIFTLQVNLTEQEPHTIWAICGNTAITDPTEAHTLFKTFSRGAHKDRSYHTHISSSSKPNSTPKI